MLTHTYHTHTNKHTDKHTHVHTNTHLLIRTIEFGPKRNIENADSACGCFDIGSFARFPGFVLFPCVRVQDAFERLGVVVSIRHVYQTQTQLLRRHALHIIRNVGTCTMGKLNIAKTNESKSSPRKTIYSKKLVYKDEGN